MASTTGPPGWFADPFGRHELRYWNGATWTPHVSTAGNQALDELPPPVPSTLRERVAARQRQDTSAVEATSGGKPRIAPQAQGAPGTEDTGSVPFFGVRAFARDLQTENRRLSDIVDKFGLREAVDRDLVLRDLNERIATARRDLEQISGEVRAAVEGRRRLEADVVDLRGIHALQEVGLYDYIHPAESSVSLATELEGLRHRIKTLAAEGKATTATSGFMFNNSPQKGAKFVRDMSKLMLRSYNAEAENCVKSVRAGTLASAQKRLSASATQVARLGAMIDLRIDATYHNLRLRELELASRHLQTLQREKELERERREELRQQRKAEQELAREKERLQKEQSHYANVLAALEGKGDLEGAARIRAQLEDVERAISDVDYRAANIRAGYVYVISNLGSFGPDVVKIGMTRRLEPMDRVNELGDASVPFRFDVHALFFAEDAVAIEAMLHRHFAERRINRVNLRREYFRTTPYEVLEVLRESNVEVVEYEVEPAALEYRSSIRDVTSGSGDASPEVAV